MEEKKFKELLLENNEILMQQMENMIKKSEERQNSKLAYLEFSYGEKISAIFDKIQSIEDILKEMKKEFQSINRKINHHGDILYSHNLRISKLEDNINSN